MAPVHVCSSSGEQSSYTDEHLRALWQQGALPPDMLYWVQGMGDWRPLREYFVQPPGTQPLAASATTQLGPIGGFRYVKDPTGVTRFLRAMLGCLIAVTVVDLVSNLAELAMLRSDFTQQPAEANDLRQGMIGLLGVVVYIVNVVALAMWVCRANVNCRGFGARGPEFTPGWSIGYYFIRFLSLYKPYYAMVEIWKVSANPLDWRSEARDDILPRWWCLWLLSGLLGQTCLRLSLTAESIPELQRATSVAIASGLADIVLCAIALSLVSAISGMQEKLVGRVA